MPHRIPGYMIQLSDIARLAETLQKQYNDEVAAIAEKYAPSINKLKEETAAVERQMLKVARDKKKEIFGAADIYATKYGRLIRELTEKITIPRDALAKCEEHGFDEAIRIAKSLDRAVVEKWPDERLFLVGAKKDMVEKITYELTRPPARTGLTGQSGQEKP
ncbi:MAG TPA: host-nuclease inhibitor Gam family protein [Bacillota bacterium]|nr:host-nuclease inhibitor Gam family protein [Bacillota bacterium]